MSACKAGVRIIYLIILLALLYHPHAQEKAAAAGGGTILADPGIKNQAEIPPFSVSAQGGAPVLKITASRSVVLDDPSGWVNGFGRFGGQGNQISGEETRIRLFVLAMDSNGRAAGGISVSIQIFSPDGSLNHESLQVTDANGFAGFIKDMDNLNQRPFSAGSTEGTWKISVSSTIDGKIVNAETTFIYDEFGCGKSGAACHVSQDWQQNGVGPRNLDGFGNSISRNSPYVQNRDNFHGTNGHGQIEPFPQILRGECLTCHRSYNGTYTNASQRQSFQPQAPAGLHSRIACTGCHGIYDTVNPVQDMPVMRCYDCHPPPRRNTNLTVINYEQSAVQSYSFDPLNTTNTIRAHDPGNTVPCISCHGSGHNITKPFIPQVPDTTTEFQHCISCHTAYIRHNGSVSCTVCHSQDAHEIRVFAHDGTYITGSASPARGNCTTCHQDRGIFDSLIKQPKSGSHTGKSPVMIKTPLNHSNDTSAGRKWNLTPGYWTQGNDGGAQNSACLYCHGRTLHTAGALGRPSLFMGGNIINSSILSTSSWCASCHWQGYISGGSEYSNTVKTFNFPDEGLILPPEISGNLSFGANRSNPVYFNHSGFAEYSDDVCRGCHGSDVDTNITAFMHNVFVGISGGGPDCISCHDTGGIGAPANKRINSSIMKQGAHKNLNSIAINSSVQDPLNKACWACHGEGSQPTGHPPRYRDPRECATNDCHSLSQSFSAPMVYSHFRDADLNGNPGNATTENISTIASCESCHSNSINAGNGNLRASVSHYATDENLIDSKNCTDCHLDRENAKTWGNAAEIYKNRSSLIEIDKDRNKKTAATGDFVDLGTGYRLKVTAVSAKGRNANIELYERSHLIETAIVSVGRYVHEENRIIDNAISKIPVITLNITGIFISDNGSFIQFEGSRIKRDHYETKNTSCYQCHFRGGLEKHRYLIIDNIDEDVFFTEVLFNSSDENEIEKRKTLREGQRWNLAEKYAFTLEEVSRTNESARFSLEVDGMIYKDIVKKGEVFLYDLRTNYPGNKHINITIFRANVSGILEPVVVLDDIIALSPRISKINENSTIYGYNASWLHVNDTIMTGGIPSDLHAPLLHDGRDGGPDCGACHQMDLGFHRGINNVTDRTSSGNPACWACHGDGREPQWHPALYKDPLDCGACHTGRLFNAPYIGDEEHASVEGCNSCHLTGTHRIISLDVLPGIRSLSVPGEIHTGEKIRLEAVGVAGFGMKIRRAEVYIDSREKIYPMSAKDGSFDETVEELIVEIDTAGLEPGTHTVYARAMERDEKWSEEGRVTFELKEQEKGMLPDVGGKNLSTILMVFFIILVVLLILNKITKLKSLKL